MTDTSAAPLSLPTAAAQEARISAAIAAELGVRPAQVRAAITLMDDGASVPFIARYRKEATGTLDDAQLRELEERLRYLRDLEARRIVVLETIFGLGKLTAALRRAVEDAATKSELEDLYLPYKSTRKTKADAAREAGLEPLLDVLLRDTSRFPAVEADAFVDASRGVGSADDALAGARSILIERAGQDASLVGDLRERLWKKGRLRSAVKAGKSGEGEKFKDYFDFAQPPHTLPSHRVLALLRGEKEGVLSLDLSEADPRDAEAQAQARAGYENAVARSLGISDSGRAADSWLMTSAKLAWRTRILTRLSVDLRVRLFQSAEEESVRVFAANLRDVLLAAPAGNRATLGLDPGLRTGTKVAVVDGTGKVAATDTIYPHAPAKRWNEALATLVTLAQAHKVELVAIGNGTASRETDKLAAELVAELKRLAPERQVTKLVVSEAGASVYSASALASAELPGMDVSLRGAVSIARRLQDPLAELVKIDPKSIGVGQYQHDLTPAKLERSLGAVVEDCVNAVGVDLNTASPALLARVAGVGPLLSENIVAHRNEHGPFGKRRELLKVARLGPKAYEQCAGFLRITGGSEPLDASSVHPEAYGVARKILAAVGAMPSEITAGVSAVAAVNPADFVEGDFGVPTVADIVAELQKPGRDPRPRFETATFTDGIEKITDLRPGMILEGTVSNVAAFGAFVDIGVHQDGLVHVSAMSNFFVSDPRTVVKSGQVVRVKVLEVEPDRKRISLTLRLDDTAGAPSGTSVTAFKGSASPADTATSDVGSRTSGRPSPRQGGHQGGARGGSHSGNRPARPATTPPAANTAMAEALRRAGLGK
ncbi:RNA-binding transcriptional accessory protein [Arthrobacter psychrolactophilus]|uniref:RNA-binding transcriptional accessory protein n=1 Tax=Arthrobacter psychrolactophilus TaxID=92442 RepID=A0A2V5INV5_9MICC|nr:Tex family protein [Arthrobacter psychrolactophilus]PYI38278.1 RNA-binding transcriptional accessory protein [Arthrobacter psychrolactophilus]